MQPSLQTLVQQSFALGPYKQQKLGRAALFTTRFGLVVFVLGMLWLCMSGFCLTAGVSRCKQNNLLHIQVWRFCWFQMPSDLCRIQEQ